MRRRAITGSPLFISTNQQEPKSHREIQDYQRSTSRQVRIHDAVSTFITAEPKTSFPKRVTTILVPTATIGTTVLLSLTALTAAGHGPLPQGVAETMVTQASEHGGIDFQTAAAAGVILYVGESMLIYIMEKIVRPLIAAGEARGEARGQAKAHEEFEAWKQDQHRKGVVFAGDEEEARRRGFGEK